MIESQPIVMLNSVYHILRPILFNNYVHDLNDHAQSSTITFADDSTFYKSFKATQVSQGAKELEDNFKSIQNWSNQRNLIFSATRTKSMIFSTQEMSKRHKLHQKDPFAISSNDKEMECVKSTTLFMDSTLMESGTNMLMKY